MQPENDIPFLVRKFRTMTLCTLALDYIGEVYAPLRHAPERLARATQATPAAAKNWLRRQNAPHAEHIGALMESDPVFRQRVAAWIATLP